MEKTGISPRKGIVPDSFLQSLEKRGHVMLSVINYLRGEIPAYIVFYEIYYTITGKHLTLENTKAKAFFKGIFRELINKSLSTYLGKGKTKTKKTGNNQFPEKSKQILRVVLNGNKTIGRDDMLRLP
jgi:hypothetical protein